MKSSVDTVTGRVYQQTIHDPDKLSPKWNALKHGLRSAAVLLPEDDAQEFQRLLRDLVLTYRPGTREEAACVEAMATHHWRIARYRRWQAVYDAQTDALVCGDPGTPPGHICETDPHRWMHKSMDCALQESRFDRLLCRARDKLLLLQKLRRNNRIIGAMEADPGPWFAEPPADTGAGLQQDASLWPSHPAHAQQGESQSGSGDAASAGADRDPPPHPPGAGATVSQGEGAERTPHTTGLGRRQQAAGQSPASNSSHGEKRNSGERSAQRKGVPPAPARTPEPAIRAGAFLPGSPTGCPAPVLATLTDAGSAFGAGLPRSV